MEREMRGMIIHHFFVLSLFFIFFGLVSASSIQGKTYSVLSPDKNIEVRIDIGLRIEYSVLYMSKPLIVSSPISLELEAGKILGMNPNVQNVADRAGDQVINPVVPEKRQTVVDKYNEITIDFQEDFGLVFRAYDDGVAYRFKIRMDGKVKIKNEQASFCFPADYSVYFPEAKTFHMSFENTYSYLPLSEIDSEKMAFAPVLVDIPDGPKVAITEADLFDYPGMFLTGTEDSSFSLVGRFAPFPKKEEKTRDRTLKVMEAYDHIAETEGTRAFPWRVCVIAAEDGKLIESDMVYRLAPPLKLEDTSWIRSGKVAWDWWNALNLYAVDFESGINTQTYLHYIDFASEHGIEYVILDEGWSDTTDLLKINPEIDLERLIDHAAKKGVGIILWCVWITLDKQLERALDAFREWGVKGIKVDFMDRDDQKVVVYYWRVAAEAAKRQLLVNFHGAYKPTGLRRAYPNVLTREGVLGLEYSKWSNRVTPDHDLLIPFIRMLAGPMDFTPGAMINAQKTQFHAVFTRPMSQGTRVHQLAMYVVYESPMQMLCDSPSNYRRELEMMEFLSAVPTVWDETVVLDARVGDYVVVARKRGEEWYVGAMTDWESRTLKIDFSFLGEGVFTADIYADGPNASRMAGDYQRSTRQLQKSDVLEIHLAPGGGWTALIKPTKSKQK
jgi:alpha-glucosidase